MTGVKKDSFVRAYEKIFAPSKAVLQKDFTYCRYSYGDVFALAAGLKNTLPRHKGEKTICLCTTNTAVIAACVLASLAGACQLVLPYSFASHTITEMLNTIGFDFAIADHPEEMPTDVKTITPFPAATDDIFLKNNRNPDEIFLRLFTGGSTGKPKVWSKSPRNLLTEAFHIREKFGFSDKDLFAATVPPYHIYGLLFSVLVPFVSHARILPDIYTFPQEIISTINKHKASVLVSVPIHYRVLKVDNLSVPSLQFAFSSAGALDRSDGLHFYKKTGLDITEIYGSTETGGVASRCVSDATGQWQPFDIVSWKLKDNRLCVKSDFTSPEMEKDEDGYCRTGDEAVEGKGNRFALMGRADGVVKIAGKRVDLLEIQNKIKSLPTVHDAFVLALPSNQGRDSIVAAVVACDLTETHLKKLMMEILEPYAVPRRFKIVPSIVRTATGKIDRRRIEEFFLPQKQSSE
jgi:acyl-coenzyme A synthetase/AMP-(fatty) acid ligase